jgi:aspartate dehydrogenase
MKQADRLPRVAVIGYGAITRELVRCLAARGKLDALLGVLVRRERLAESHRAAAGKFAAVADMEALLGLEPDIVVECAGQDAMRQYAAAVLAHGTDLMCASVGALADRELQLDIARAAQSRARLWIPSGAVAGIDGLLAARTAGLRHVTYTSSKPPDAWNGTPAESMLVGAARERRTTFFEGTAREAALTYPQNANVGATVSFAGLGLDHTIVKLVSDPDVSGPIGVIEATGDFGRFRFEVLAYASPDNPKTSTLTAHSILMALRHGVCYSVLPGSETLDPAG